VKKNVRRMLALLLALLLALPMSGIVLADEAALELDGDVTEDLPGGQCRQVSRKILRLRLRLRSE